MRGIHRSPVNSPHKGPVTRKMFPFNDVIVDLELLTVVFSILISNFSDFQSQRTCAGACMYFTCMPVQLALFTKNFKLVLESARFYA